MSQIGPGCVAAQKDQEKQASSTNPVVAHKVPRPLVLDSSQYQQPNPWQIVESALHGEAMMGLNSQERSDVEAGSLSSGVANPNFHEQLNPSHLVPYQMGLWAIKSDRKKENPAELNNPVDFLDICFFCNRRLGHERDIFIYKGDTAFCSEECRHRQILSDERRSLRASKKGSSTSETAVAA